MELASSELWLATWRAFSRELLIFESEPSPAPDGQQGRRHGWQSCLCGLGRRNCQQGRDAAAADIVDAREHDIVTLDFHHDRRGEALAVELAQRHREVGGLAVPADREVGAKRHLRRALRPTYRDLPYAPLRRRFLPLDQLVAQAIGRLLQRQSPIIEHEQTV